MKKRKTEERIKLCLILAVAVLAVGICTQFRMYIVQSGSMEPTLPVGSIIIVNIRAKEAVPGEIVTFHVGSTIVTHRAVGQLNGRYITKGDANSEPDTVRTEPDRIIGTVCGRIPYLGKIVLYIKQLPEKLAEFITSLISEITAG